MGCNSEFQSFRRDSWLYRSHPSSQVTKHGSIGILRANMLNATSNRFPFLDKNRQVFDKRGFDISTFQPRLHCMYVHAMHACLIHVKTNLWPMKQKSKALDDTRSEPTGSGVQSRGKAAQSVNQRELIQLREEKAQLKHEIAVLRVRHLVCVSLCVNDACMHTFKAYGHWKPICGLA